MPPNSSPTNTNENNAREDRGVEEGRSQYSVNRSRQRITRDGNKTYRNNRQQELQESRQDSTDVTRESKISTGYFLLLIIFSVLCDILCAVIDDGLPGVGEVVTLVIDPVIGGIFWFMFSLRGVSFSKNATRGVTVFAAPLVEMILGWVPILGWFEWTAEVVIIVWSIWNEEKKEREAAQN